MTQKSVLWAFLKLVRLDYSLYGALGVFLSGFLAGDIQGFQSIAKDFGYSITLVAKEDSTEINPVDFQLYELRRKK